MVKLLNDNNEVRFARGSNEGWSPKKEEYRLAPNQMKAYLSGTPMDEARSINPIWEDGEPEAAPDAKVEEEPIEEIKEVDKVVESDQSKVMTPGLYRKHKDEGLTDKEIMDRYGINNVYLSQWKKDHFTPEEIKAMRKPPRKDFTINPKKTAIAREEQKLEENAARSKQESLEAVKIQLDQTRKLLNDQDKELSILKGEKAQLKNQLNVALEELKSGQPASSYTEVKINQLKAEVSTLRNELKTYQDEEIMSNETIMSNGTAKVNENQELNSEMENLKREVIDAHKLVTDFQERYEHLKENFETAIISKDALQQENITLTNRADSLLKKIKHMEDTHIRFNQDYSKLEEETVALRQYAAVKTRSDLERIQ